MEVEQHLHGEWSWTVSKPVRARTFPSTSTDEPHTLLDVGIGRRLPGSAFAANAAQALWITAGAGTRDRIQLAGGTRRRKDYRVVGLVGGADAETLVVMLQAAMSFCRLVWIGWRRRTMASSRAMSNCLAASPNSVIA